MSNDDSNVDDKFAEISPVYLNDASAISAY